MSSGLDGNPIPTDLGALLMPKYTTSDIRNLAIVGSAGAGKTSLVELMLNKAGVIGRVGRVEDGNTVCDYDDLEKEFKK